MQKFGINSHFYNNQMDILQFQTKYCGSLVNNLLIYFENSKNLN